MRCEHFHLPSVTKSLEFPKCIDQKWNILCNVMSDIKKAIVYLQLLQSACNLWMKMEQRTDFRPFHIIFIHFRLPLQFHVFVSTHTHTYTKCIQILFEQNSSIALNSCWIYLVLCSTELFALFYHSFPFISLWLCYFMRADNFFHASQLAFMWRVCVCVCSFRSHYKEASAGRNRKMAALLLSVIIVCFLSVVCVRFSNLYETLWRAMFSLSE